MALAVGVQGLVEAATGLVIGGAIAKGVAHALKRDRDPLQAQQAVYRSKGEGPEAPIPEVPVDDTLKLIEEDKK